MKLKIGQECGQRWYRLSSWRVWDRVAKKYRYAKIRRWSDGFAIGPIMVWWTPREPFCTQCSGPYGGWLMEQYGGHWDTCANRPKGGRP